MNNNTPVRVLRNFYIVTVAAASMSGCASIDFDYPRLESTAMVDTDATYLGSRISALTRSKPESESGFYSLSDGIDALTVRLLLANRAERSIDAQYYLIKTDTTSLAFIDALLNAADRGVRVRLLIDDVFTSGYDVGMGALNSHPNFEIRIFNPFQRGIAGRAWSSVTDLGRINRRMHTKSFTVDNQVTIVGGRNIADEYFGAHDKAKFGDLDVVGIGKIAADVSEMFDSFWNHETALPLQAFTRTPEDLPEALEDLRSLLDESRESAKNSKYAEAVIETAHELLDEDNSEFEWAPYQLIYDSPDKGIRSKILSRTITTPLLEALNSAEEELIVISPYFVPRKTGIEIFSRLQSRGVKVTIITNSLAANNHAGVHGGYAPSRKPLLNNGIRLFEVRPDADIPGSEIFSASGAKATLHTKAFLVDRKEVFIGSFNFDPRSANLNTESGVLIQSRRLTEEFGESVDTALEKQTYEVFLDNKNRVRWRGFEDGHEVIYETEPLATWAQRFVAGFMRLLPLKGQL